MNKMQNVAPWQKNRILKLMKSILRMHFLREASVPLDNLRVPLGIEERIADMHTG